MKQWTDDSVEELRHSLESAEWSVFFDGCSSHVEMAETLNDYVRSFAQNQLDVFSKAMDNKKLKTYLNKKKYAFIRGNRAVVRELEKEFRRKATLAKLAYKDKVKEKVKSG